MTMGGCDLDRGVVEVHLAMCDATSTADRSVPFNRTARSNSAHAKDGAQRNSFRYVTDALNKA